MPPAHPFQPGGGRRRLHLLQRTAEVKAGRGAAAWVRRHFNHSPAGYGSRLRGPGSIPRRRHPEDPRRPASFLLRRSSARGDPSPAALLGKRTRPAGTPPLTPPAQTPGPRSCAPRETLLPPPTALYLLVGCGELLTDHGTGPS